MCSRGTLSRMLWSSRHRTAYAFYLGTPRSARQPRWDCSVSSASRWGSGRCHPPASPHRSGRILEVSRRRRSGPLLRSEHHRWDKPAPLRRRSAWWGGSGSKTGLWREAERVRGPVCPWAAQRWKEPKRKCVSGKGEMQCLSSSGNIGLSVKPSAPRSFSHFPCPLICVQTCPFIALKPRREMTDAVSVS